MTLIYLVAMARWACTCTTASGAPRRPWASPTPRGPAATPSASASILAVVIAGGFSLVPIFVLAGVIDEVRVART